MPSSKSRYERIWPLEERLKAVIVSLLLVGVFGWIAVLAVLQFWLLPQETNRGRAALAAILVAPVASYVAWRGYFCRYHAILIYPDWTELRRGKTRDEFLNADVLALIGQGGLNLDGGDLIVWKRLVILTEESRHVLGFQHETHAEVYRNLRAACPQAWGIPIPARLEPPVLAGRPEIGSVVPVGLGVVGRFYRWQIVRTAVVGNVFLVGSLTLTMLIWNSGINDRNAKGLIGLIVGMIVGLLLIATAIRDFRVLRTLQRGSDSK